jgi:hypothetical protein
LQWRLNGAGLTDTTRITGARTSTLVISNVLRTDAGNYSVLAANDNGFAFSSSAALSVFPLRLIQPTWHPDGRFHLNFQGESGFRFEILTSSNLTTWEPLLLLTNETGAGELNDTTATNQPQRFYRAIERP